MSKRKYTNLQILLPEIKEMIAEGKSHREIEEHFGLTGERPIHHLLKQEHRREKKLEAGVVQRPKGRPRKDGQPPKQNVETEVKRLRMENKLLRDFLQSIERKRGQRSSMPLSIVTGVSTRYLSCVNSLRYPVVVTMTL